MAAVLWLAASGCATVPPRPPRPADWVSHRVCGKDTRPGRGERYCIEVISLEAGPVGPVRGVALLVPGMFQNARVFDLMPKRGISYARSLVRHGLRVFLVSVRGIGHADLPPGSDLDDLAIDDLPRAIAWVHRKTGRKVIVIGHSQGAMTLQASLAGLARCPGGPCFDAEVAARRQSEVRALGLYAGNVGLTHLDPKVRTMAFLATLFQGPLRLLFDRLPARWISVESLRLAGSAAYDHVEYQAAHVPLVVQRAFVSDTYDASTVGIGLQLAEGALDGEMRSGGVPWRTALPNITVPVVMETFGADAFSPPLATWRDDFRWLGSRHKISCG